jgi:ABC-2 type transport system permease protein
MKSISAAFITECIKLRRSGIFWITVIIFIVVPLMIGLMMFVAKNPEISAKLGLVGTKANLFGQTNWAGFSGLIVQTMASIGYIGFGFVTSWVFGREYSERTIKDILSLPVSRSAIVAAKFFVIIIWSALLAFILFSVSIIIGQFVGISGLSSKLFTHFATKFFVTSFLTMLLCTPVAFFASYGRGIIVPIGFLIITLIMAQFLGLVGLGPYFPWSIPGVFTAPAGTAGMNLLPVSYIILVLTSITGFIGTISWWRLADQH